MKQRRYNHSPNVLLLIPKQIITVNCRHQLMVGIISRMGHNTETAIIQTKAKELKWHKSHLNLSCQYITLTRVKIDQIEGTAAII